MVRDREMVREQGDKDDTSGALKETGLGIVRLPSANMLHITSKCVLHPAPVDTPGRSRRVSEWPEMRPIMHYGIRKSGLHEAWHPGAA
jgi:hypothetical protein